ncbi:gamma subclass chorismate mutase AroQ [Brucella intermedia]|uniref:gamma subclass chorismate mutase AroQ n=1 Tax=Brucella intermedia TaxID=94625 RepID=UPI00124E9E2C|nr:gamma subclass chorismate mutase AroQ [Brucella intermedia]KAB2727600.1 gamma subclass chorismate mutase AroQ [Brucella intermedia]
MNDFFIFISSSILFSSLSILPCNAADIETIANFIGERLAHMQSVALFKEANHIPIEDLIQEGRVIAQSLERAQALGLDQGTVKSFIDIQMKAAKAVQYRYRADWLFKQGKISSPTSLDWDRQQIAKLGNELLELMATRLNQGITIDAADKKFFLHSLNAYNLQHDEKIQIFQALLKIKLA